MIERSYIAPYVIKEAYNSGHSFIPKLDSKDFLSPVKPEWINCIIFRAK